MQDSLRKIAEEISKCRRCALHKFARRAVPGQGPAKAKVFLIGQAPGKEEDRTGKPFVGRSGQFLNKLLQRAGLERERVFITSVVKHFPPKNRFPKQNEVKACRPYLIRQLMLVNPAIVVLMGNLARRALMSEQALKGRIVLKTAHPAAGMRFPKIRVKMEQAFDRLKKILKAKP